MIADVPSGGHRTPPSRVGDYEIVRRLGVGAMAEVLLGKLSGPRGFSRTVAIKRLHTDLTGDGSVVSMFVDEARLCSRLSHENIAQVLDFGQDGDSFFIAMEHVAGRTLREIIDGRSGPRLQEEVAAHVVAKVCAALHYAHRACDDHDRPLGVVHRDVKPSNILVSSEGEIKLIDFGVAKAAQRLHQTVGLVIKGSYAYMSPEQASGETVDFRSDIFSAGTLLYELAAGENPFLGASPVDTLERVRHVRLVPLLEAVPGVSSDLARVCERALATERSARFRSAGEMQSELERFCRRRGFGANEFRHWATVATDPGRVLRTAGSDAGGACPSESEAATVNALRPQRSPRPDRTQALVAATPDLANQATEQEDLVADVARAPDGDGTDVRTVERYERELPEEETIDEVSDRVAPAGMRGAPVRTLRAPAPGLAPRAPLAHVPTMLPVDSFPELAPLIGKGGERCAAGKPAPAEWQAHFAPSAEPEPEPPSPGLERRLASGPGRMDGATPAARSTGGLRRPASGQMRMRAAEIADTEPLAEEPTVSGRLRPGDRALAWLDTGERSRQAPAYSSLKVVMISLLVTLGMAAAAVVIWLL